MITPLRCLLLIWGIGQAVLSTAQIKPTSPDPAPVKKAAVPRSFVTVRADAAAKVIINFDSVGVIAADQGRQFTCPVGDIMLEVVDRATRYKATYSFKLTVNENKLVDVDLKAQQQAGAAAKAEEQRQIAAQKQKEAQEAEQRRRTEQAEAKSERRSALTERFEDHLAHRSISEARSTLSMISDEFPDLVHDCNACSGGTIYETLSCGTCSGSGCAVCGRCGGDYIISCTSCGGDGIWTDGYRTEYCNNCQGKGGWYCSCRCLAGGQKDTFGKFITGEGKGYVTCSDCGGKGQWSTSESCTECYGIGKVIY